MTQGLPVPHPVINGVTSKRKRKRRNTKRTRELTEIIHQMTNPKPAKEKGKNRKRIDILMTQKILMIEREKEDDLPILLYVSEIYVLKILI